MTQADLDLADKDIQKWSASMRANGKAVSNWRNWAALVRLHPELGEADLLVLINRRDSQVIADEWDRLGFTVRRPAAKPVQAPAPAPTPAPVAPAVPGLTPTEAMLLQALQGLKAKGLI